MQVKSFAIWANAEKEQVPALVQSTLVWANENTLEDHLADQLKSIDIDSDVSYFSTKNFISGKSDAITGRPANAYSNNLFGKQK